ncbi:MAG: hypothetical protein GY702_23385 [Desulfobulbaceae bacterium]|nr:hypothetical protein [Desulfobulbaceae bacterium]
MNYRKFYAGGLLSFLLATGAHGVPLPQSGQDNLVEWQVQQQWPTKGKTLDMVHALDGKSVYILNDENKVQVFTNQGKLQGSIPVANGVTSIDIAPQGETLYLVNNQNNTFSSLSVSLVHTIDTTGSPFEGPADAPVTLSIFTDFE